MALPGPATLPATHLASLLLTANLGEPHKTLAPETRWLPPAELDSVRRETRDLATELGWHDRHGRLDREVAASLAVLCRPQVEFYGWIAHEGRTRGALAGRIGRDAVLAVRDPDETVRLRPIGHDRLPDRLVALTPDVPAGHGPPLVVSAAEVRATRPDGRTHTPAGVGIRRAPPDVRRAYQLATTPSTGHGELLVATSDVTGRRRTPRALRYTDTTVGRFAVLTETDGDRVRLEPATRADLVRHLAKMSDARRC